MIRLSSYKLIQFLKEYVNPEGIEISIVICSHIAWRWLYRLKFEYKEVCKDIFIDSHEWLDVVEVQNQFLIIMKELESYIVEFDKDSVIKAENYPSNYIIRIEK